MLLHYNIIFATVIIASSQELEKTSNEADISTVGENFPAQADKPTIHLYYESLCPGCKELVTTQFKKIVELLHQYVEINTYPYGNVETYKDSDGNMVVDCQHGEEECYGNKLHGCALDIIANQTEALLLNSCTMKYHSDDDSADKCGKQMNINVDSIKECAKSKKGEDILIHYGEESKKVDYNYVPYVLLNGNEWTGNDLFSDVCATFQNSPKPCNQD